MATLEVAFLHNQLEEREAPPGNSHCACTAEVCLGWSAARSGFSAGTNG